jgi:hypothetical protein
MTEPIEAQPVLDGPPAPVRRRRSPLRRLGCGIALVFWFLVLLLPCALFTMATQGQITISQGGLPGQEIRVWLIMEIEQRGLGVSSTSVHGSDPNALCLQTNVSYLLWAGRADPTTYCDCYARPDAQNAWELVSTQMDACG